MMYALRNCIAALVLIGAASPARQAVTSEQSAHAPRTAEQIVLSVDPARSTVHWSVESSLHTVHGTFHVKRGIVSVDPATGKATGEIVVDATSGESGNNARDRRMHKEILESFQYSEVVFRPDHADGTIAAQGNSSVKLHGIFSLQGADHERGNPSDLKRRSVDRYGSLCSSLYRVGIEKPKQLFVKGQASRGRPT